MDLRKIAIELGVPVESLNKYNKPLLDKYLASLPKEIPKHKHSYRKDETCACGAVRKPK